MGARYIFVKVFSSEPVKNTPNISDPMYETHPGWHAHFYNKYVETFFRQYD